MASGLPVPGLGMRQRNEAARARAGSQAHRQGRLMIVRDRPHEAAPRIQNLV